MPMCETEKSMNIKNMSNKAINVYFIIFAALYFVYTVFIAGHGIHWTNSIITIAVAILAIYYYLKSRAKA